MTTETHHATCVAFGDMAVLVTGASGSGKSSLALELMALGAELIADDRVTLTATDVLTARCPAAIKGQIEARGVGILNATTKDSGTVSLVVDMDRVEPDRLPPRREITVLGHDLPLFYRAKGIHFAFCIAQFLRAGRSDVA